MANDTGNMTLIDHLRDLKKTVVRSLWGIAIGFIICYQYTGPILDVIRAPITPYLPTGGLVFTGPIDKFFAHLKVAFYGGVILSAPWWLYQIWQFVAPGLYRHEKKATVTFIGVGSFLFATGVAFTYFLVFPMAFKFLMTFGGETDKPMITIDQYLSFFVWTSLSFGAAFELPLILVTLGMLGIVSHEFLKKNRKYAIVILSVITAIITPPDVLSMLLMLVPLWILFDLSVFLVGVIEKRRSV
ncbi:MAG: twin-arginine translocase subunit TatC [Bdellovibrionaceae bacterium]|nr:twin-arginine translocase subunit TatC [Pseudobdellovibrionaceae bacterium]MDW8191291.1 twin-arginine translocase subunit TatC [Pseudobdellovibrionaceae bacterium]